MVVPTTAFLPNCAEGNVTSMISRPAIQDKTSGQIGGLPGGRSQSGRYNVRWSSKRFVELLTFLNEKTRIEC
jgi:hypothetical protein